MSYTKRLNDKWLLEMKNINNYFIAQSVFDKFTLTIDTKKYTGRVLYIVQRSNDSR